MAALRVQVGDQTVELAAGESTSIGRSSDCGIVLTEPTVGRRHAEIRADGEGWVLVDCGTRNGTWVDGQRITSMPVDRPMLAELGAPPKRVIIRLTPPGGRGREPTFPIAAASTMPVSPDAAPPPANPTMAVVAGGPAAPRGPAPLAQVAVPAGPAAAPPLVPPPPGSPPVPAPPVLPAPRPGPVAAPGPAMTAPPNVPLLVTRLDGEQRMFPIGAIVRIGREAGLELVSQSPLVSRQVHGVITSDYSGATYTDQSRRGTFLDGKPLHGPLRITRSVVLRLGDPATGAELGITPPLPADQIEANRRRVGRGRRVGVIAAVCTAALILLVAASATTWYLTRRPANRGQAAPTGLSQSTLVHAQQSTVRLLMGSPTDATGWGSGTVISPDGLILTNVHVAQPQATGHAVAVGAPGDSLDPNPPYLTVEMTTGQSAPAVARYRAKPVAVDGYLDLAVVAIYATASGAAVDPTSLHLPFLPIGDVNTVSLADPVTILGYPGIADSDSITVTNGVISTFVPDPLHHVADPRFELETTARVAHGNSGGAAINNAGQLIGVPSLAVASQDGDVSWRLRAVTAAAPLVAAARAHATYHSHILVDLTGSEQVLGIGIGTDSSGACSAAATVAGPLSRVDIGIGYAGFPAGVDTAIQIQGPDGTTVLAPDGALPQSTASTSSGCAVIEVDASAFNATVLPSGTYRVRYLAGPDLQTIGASAALVIQGP